MQKSDAKEQGRLEAHKPFPILEAFPEAVFDRSARSAARICDVPIAAITLIDERRQWFKAAVDLAMSETARSISFCTHTVLGKNPLVLLPLMHPADRQRLLEAVELALQGKQPLILEYRIVRKEGEVRDLPKKSELRHDAQGIPWLAGTTQEITARRTSQEQLALLETSIERISDIVMITEAEPLDEPGPRIVYVNDAFEHETGYRREEVLGRSPRLLQGPKTQRTELDRIRTALEKRQAVTAELINYTKSGAEFWVELEITPVADTAGRLTHFVSIQRNITERKQQQLKLAQTNRALRMLTRSNEALLKVDNEQELIEQICRVAVEVGGYRMAWVGYAQDDKARSIRPVAYAGAHLDVPDLAKNPISWSEDTPAGHGPGGRAIRSGMAIVSEDVTKDPGFSPWLNLAQRQGFSGVVSLPLRDQQRSFGILALHATEVRSVAEDELRLLQELADNLAFGIVNIRSKQARQRMEAAVLKVAAGVSASVGTEFFEQLTRNMTEALGAQAGLVARLVPGEPLTLRTLSAVADGKVLENFDYTIAGSHLECVVHEEHSIVREAASLFPACPSLASLQAQACVARRLDNAAGQPIGVLWVLFRQLPQEVNFIGSTLQIFAARVAAELERREAVARIRDQAALLDKAKDAIIVAGTDNRIMFWNKGAEHLFHWTAEEALGKTKEELFVEDIDAFQTAHNAVLERGEWSGEIRKRRKDGRVLTVESHWTLVKDDDGKPQSILAIETDITRRKAAEQEIERLAFFDQLTQLPNRRLLLDRLQHAMAVSERNEHTGALLFIDLDNFKTLNDTLGHDKGDMLLQQVARRLESCVRKSNTVARLGGDEFVVMLDDLSRNAVEAAAQAEIVGEKILASFHQAFKLGDYEHHSTPSIGVALFDHSVNTVDELLKRADLAMYQAKAAGRNTIRFFDPEMQTIVTARVALESDLRQGLQQQEFFLQYQPQTDHAGHVTGVEALVRWKHAGRGVVSPASFIPLAEETGLILRLGHWVLESVCMQLVKWAARQDTAHMSIAVNVSARQFHHPDFAKQVLAILEYTGANPKNLKLELTESMLVKNVEDTVTKMHTLKAKGVGFSLDDFGTGYSSLFYLKRFPLDQLKIDQSFVKDVLVDANDAAIARTIVALGQILGLEVMAEGVETEEQRDFLAQHGCHAYQGYLFGRPLAAEQF